MGGTTRNNQGSNVLQTWLQREVLMNLDPDLFFYSLGKKGKKAGYNTIAWAKFTKLAASDVTTGADTDDGTTPTAVGIVSSTVSVTAVQYRITATISDMVAELNVIDYVKGAAERIGQALALKIDAVIQGVIMAGTNVLYGGSAAARTALGAGDKLTAALLVKAGSFLEGKAARKIDGYWAAFIHPFQAYDLRVETGTGNWLETNKYVTNDKIMKGEIGALGGVRVAVAPYIQTFTSTVTVYPAIVMGADAYGVGEFQTLQSYLVPATPSDSDPLAQRTKVSSKIAFAAVILEEDAMVRIETSATLLF